MRLHDDLRNVACNTVVDAFDESTDPAYIELYSGDMPTFDSAATGDLLATLTMSKPAFGNAGASNPGKASANTIDNGYAAMSGTVGYFRCYNGDGDLLAQGEAGGDGDGKDLTLNSVDVLLDSTITISTFSITI